MTETKTETETEAAAFPLGFWKRIQMPSDHDKQNNNTSMSPLFTRYQPQHCRSKEEQMDDRCHIPMSRHQFDPYTFQFSTRTNKTIVNGQYYLNKTIDDNNDNDNSKKNTPLFCWTVTCS